MNEQEIEQAAEIVGAMKDLFKEFESRLGEIVSTQRIASSEARAEGAKVAKDLHELRSAARTVVDEQRALVSRLEREWQLRIDSNAQRAGEAQAQAFGAGIARGLQGQLEELAADVKSATQRYTWKSSLQWALGIAIAIPLTVGVCVSVLSPHVEPPLLSHALNRRLSRSWLSRVGCRVSPGSPPHRRGRWLPDCRGASSPPPTGMSASQSITRRAWG